MNYYRLTLIVGAILVVGVAVAGGLYVYRAAPGGVMTSTVEEAMQEQEETVELATFNSEELGLSFEYPVSYTLESHEEGTDERNWTTLTLIETDVLNEFETNGAMEGPPAITVQVFENLEGYGLEEWITTTSYSNYKLATDETLLEGEVGGEPALAYRYSGLYENNAIAVAHDGRVYLFTVGWLTQDAANIFVLGDILESVQFN